MSMNTFPQGSVSERDAGFTVKWVGAQRNVLQGDISGHIALTSISGLKNLYAVGPAERLQGEVSIFDSVPSISRITDGALNIETNFNGNACFLVYAQVSAWQRVTIATAIRDEATLETYIVKVASELGINVSQPFPFLINAKRNMRCSMFSISATGLRTTPSFMKRPKCASYSSGNPSRSSASIRIGTGGSLRRVTRTSTCMSRVQTGACRATLKKSS